jgi:hypothetical protein
MLALPLPSCKILAFTFLSVVDLGLTLQLLSAGNGTVYESNPLAHWFLTRYGWAGLAVFKAALVAVVLFLSVAISLSHPRAARTVLSFACVALVPVVIYSSALASCLKLCPREAENQLVAQIWSRDSALTAEIDQTRDYAVLMTRLTNDLAAGRCSLAEGVQALQALDRAHDPRWLVLLHKLFPGKSDEACLAGNLVTAVLSDHDQGPEARARALRLAADLPATYGILVLSPDSPELGIPRKAGHAPAIPGSRRLGDL